MREIKFRGKRKYNGDWVYGDLRHQKVGDFYEIDGWTVNEDTIGQFTGLYDKNDAPIYEGDVLEIIKFLFSEEDNPETQVGDVFWYNGAFCIREIYSSDGYNEINNVLAELCYSDGTYNSWAECKIIGNIHDNPELIKE